MLQKKQPLDDILGRSLDKGVDVRPAGARPRADPRHRGDEPAGGRASSTIVLGTFLERGLPERSGTLYPILLSAAAQLIFLKTPPHAAIDLAVTLAQYDPKAKRYDKLVNAVLRRVASEGEAIAASLDAARVNTPDWLWSRWVSLLGRDARARHRRSASRSSRRSISPSRASRSFGPSGSSGRVLPTGSVRLLPKGRIEAAARL